MKFEIIISRLVGFTEAIVLILSISTIATACSYQSTPNVQNLTPTTFAPTRTSSHDNVVTATPDYLATQESDENIYDPQGWTHFPNASEMIRDEIEFMAETPNGNMWFGGGSGVVFYDGETWTTYTYKDALDGKTVSSLAITPDGILWLGTASNGVLNFDGNHWKAYTTEDGLSGNEITAIETTEDGDLWVASHTGISLFDGQNWTSYPRLSTVEDDYVQDIGITTDGIVWFGLSQGVLVHYDGEQWFHDDLAGYICCLTTTSDGALWIVAGYPNKGGHIVRLAEEMVVFSDYAFQQYPPSTISAGKNNVVWIGTSGGYQAAYYDGNTWRTLSGEDIFSKEFWDSIYVNMLPVGIVFSILEAQGGALWFGTANGVYRYLPSE